MKASDIKAVARLLRHDLTDYGLGSKRVLGRAPEKSYLLELLHGLPSCAINLS